MKKKIILSIFLLILILTGLGVYCINGDKISKNVYVQNINIGDLTKDEAKDKLSSEYKMQSFKFNYKEKTWDIDPKTLDINYDLDKTINKAYDVNRKGNIIQNIFKSLQNLAGIKTKVNLVMNCDEDKLKSELEKISKEVNKDSKDATIKIEKKKVKVVKEETGLKLDIEKTKENFIEDINKGKSTQKLVVLQIKPKIKSSDLKGIDTLLGSYSTTLYDSGYGRVQNIKLATKKTSDVILMPGETFSYNKHTGVRSAENGYKLAHVISSGKVAYGIGGGVCQVSSTLFNAVLYSGL
ncbi:MAG: VanW family protein, partial [Peptostreptococcaceae bacterium]|nr:VanW family protein [Peptostreptococcaceae bacterium]